MEGFEPEARGLHARLEPALLARHHRRQTSHLRIRLTCAGGKEDVGRAGNAEAKRCGVFWGQPVAEPGRPTSEAHTTSGLVSKVHADDGEPPDVSNPLLERGAHTGQPVRAERQ